MWIPESAKELERLAGEGRLDETGILDFKREIGSDSKSIAVDVAAMANDGGVIVYGVGEDKDKRPTILCPFALAGQKERIDAIVRSCISEPPALAR